jgi:hypothetical protein
MEPLFTAMTIALHESLYPIQTALICPFSRINPTKGSVNNGCCLALCVFYALAENHTQDGLT